MNKDEDSLLQLLSGWCDANVSRFNIGLNEYGYRGLLAIERIEPTETILLLPWKHVLGMRAARHLIDTETRNGRGMSDDDNEDTFMIRLIVICEGNDQRLWSCIMACAILSGLRYPLSTWSPYIACLPHDKAAGATSSSRLEPALRRTHAQTARWLRKIKAKKEAGPSIKLSQEVLAELKQVREDIMAVPRGDDSALDHVLMWSEGELSETGDDALKVLVLKDQQWLMQVWRQIFVFPEEDSKNSKLPPIVSLESWMWAHAIVRSRAVGMEQAPRQVTSMEYDGFSFQSEGVMLPIIDLINHDSQHYNAGLEIRPEGVAVVSTKAIGTNEEILFDYHPGATIRFFLRSYGFIDSVRQRQGFKAFAGVVELDISVTTTGGMLRLVKFDQDEFSGRLRLVIRDDYSCPKSYQKEHAIEVLIQVHAFAAATCTLLIDELSCCKEGENTASVYREANRDLLERAQQDLNVVASMFDHNVDL
jgi:hypothetical protein